MALRLIAKQLVAIHTDLPSNTGFSAGPLDDVDMLHWEASIRGPDNCPYEGGQFWLRIDFTADYPFRPPKIKFLTKIYHPNVDADGKLCIEFLQSEWKPSFTIAHMLMAIASLLMEPNADNPAVVEIADVFNKDKATFEKTAREWTLQHAGENQS